MAYLAAAGVVASNPCIVGVNSVPGRTGSSGHDRGITVSTADEHRHPTQTTVVWQCRDPGRARFTRRAGAPVHRRLGFVDGERWAGPGVDGEAEDVGPVVVPDWIEHTASRVDCVDIDVGSQDGFLVADRPRQ
jgi:hypothetical protein